MKYLISRSRLSILLSLACYSMAVNAQMDPGMSMTHHDQAQMQQCMTMMTKELGPKDANYDKRFIDMMIAHHEGAIAMAQDALNKSNHQEIQQLAKNIIQAQQQEVDQMKKWRKEWYGQ